MRVKPDAVRRQCKVLDKRPPRRVTGSPETVLQQMDSFVRLKIRRKGTHNRGDPQQKRTLAKRHVQRVMSSQVGCFQTTTDAPHSGRTLRGRIGCGVQPTRLFPASTMNRREAERGPEFPELALFMSDDPGQMAQDQELVRVLYTPYMLRCFESDGSNRVLDAATAAVSQLSLAAPMG